MAARPIPSSFRFALALFAFAVLAALASGIVQSRQKQERTRIHAETLTGGNAEAGRLAMPRYGCGGCHDIGGVTNAEGRVGPALKGLARRSLIAGKLPNSPENMMLWIRAPQHVSLGTGMPDQPMPLADARNISAYLYTLR